MFSVYCLSSLRPPDPSTGHIIFSYLFSWYLPVTEDLMAVRFVMTPSISLRNLPAVGRADSLLRVNILKRRYYSFLVLANNQEAFQELGFFTAKGGRRERRGRERGRGGIESQGSLDQPSSTPLR